MNIKNLVKSVVAKEAAKSVIGKTLPIGGGKRRLSTGKLTLGGLVLAIAGLVIQYLS